MTAKPLYQAILARLEEANIEDAGFDGLQLFAHHTGMKVANLLADPQKEIPPAQETALWQDVERRCNHEPLQYILGSWEFYGLPFLVGPGVLIPRADTEVLVDETLRVLEDVSAPKVVDLCTGSGCIPITLAKHRPDGTFVGVELSQQAADYCKKNIKANDISNMTLLERNIFDGPLELCGLDCITANPPYIPKKDLATLSKEVGQEPQMALDGGEDGLDFYRFIISRWTPALKKEGMMALEVGIDQWQAVESLLQEQFEQIYVVPDLNNIPRVLLGIGRI